MEQKYAKYTLGKSPAAIYLVDYLNTGTNPVDHKILKKIAAFRDVFSQLLKAYEAGHLDSSVVRTFSAFKRLELMNCMPEMLQKGYSPLVVNLYCNVIIADMKKFERVARKLHTVERSAIDRAKSLVGKGPKRKCKLMAKHPLVQLSKFH